MRKIHNTDFCLETHVHTYAQALTCIRTNTYICSCTIHNERSHQSVRATEEAQLPSEGNQSENATELVFTAQVTLEKSKLERAQKHQ